MEKCSEISDYLARLKVQLVELNNLFGLEQEEPQIRSFLDSIDTFKEYISGNYGAQHSIENDIEDLLDEKEYEEYMSSQKPK